MKSLAVGANRRDVTHAQLSGLNDRGGGLGETFPQHEIQAAQLGDAAGHRRIQYGSAQCGWKRPMRVRQQLDSDRRPPPNVRRHCINAVGRSPGHQAHKAAVCSHSAK